MATSFKALNKIISAFQGCFWSTQGCLRLGTPKRGMPWLPAIQLQYFGFSWQWYFLHNRIRGLILFISSLRSSWWNFIKDQRLILDCFKVFRGNCARNTMKLDLNFASSQPDLNCKCSQKLPRLLLNWDMSSRHASWKSLWDFTVSSPWSKLRFHPTEFESKIELTISLTSRCRNWGFE